MTSEKHPPKSRMIWRRIAGFIGRHKKALMVLAAILFFVFVWPMNLLGMAPVWSRSVTAQVVDAETGEPLQGVVVEAIWPSVTGTLAGGPYEWGIIQRLKTRTDEKGFFHLPSWVRIGYHNWISETDPEIHLYKAGYWSRTLKNNLSKLGRIIIWPEAWKSDWDGKVIKMKPMHWREWTKEEWEKQVSHYEYFREIHMLSLDSDDCEWKEHPKSFLENMRYQLRKTQMLSGRYEFIKLTPEELKIIEKNCGANPYQYLKRYGMTDEEWYACCAGTAKDNTIR